MKVCTITCHDVYNHGASLQAYALMMYLKKSDHNVEIINYKPDYLSNDYKLFSIDNPKWKMNLFTKLLYLILKLPSRIIGIKRKQSFDNFTSKYLKLTNTRYSSNEELKENLPYADAFICGSDQIWNTLHMNGKDPAFYLDFVPDEKIKLAYAASFGTETISDEHKPMIRENVNRLDGIGIREKSGVNILMTLGVDKSVNVVDPVLLLSKEEWDKVGKKKYKENYILIYDFENNILIRKLALEIAKEKGFVIYSINPGKVNYADKYFKYVGPETFISLIRDSSFVLSNSFHAAVFSVIYKKNFAIVNRTEKINTRMRDFLDDLNIKERLINETYDLDVLLKQVDYMEAEQILKEKVNFSMMYLKDTLLFSKNKRKVQ